MTCIVPAFTIPGGKPVTADPGSRPTSPLMTLGPVFVTVLPANTAKVLRRSQPDRRLRAEGDRGDQQDRGRQQTERGDQWTDAASLLRRAPLDEGWT